MIALQGESGSTLLMNLFMKVEKKLKMKLNLNEFPLLALAIELTQTWLVLLENSV